MSATTAIGYIKEGTFYGFLVNSPEISEQQEEGELIEQLQDVAEDDYIEFVDSSQEYIFESIDDVIVGQAVGSGFGVMIRDFAEQFVTRPGGIEMFVILTEETPNKNLGDGGPSPFQFGTDFNLLLVHSDNDPARLHSDRILKGGR